MKHIAYNSNGVCDYCGSEAKVAELFGMALTNDLAFCKNCLDKARLAIVEGEQSGAMQERERQLVADFRRRCAERE